MDVFVVGAAGGVGRRLAAQLTARGDRVTGMHRQPEQTATVTATGARSLVADLMADSVETLTEHVRGHDAVVFSAGAHGTGIEATNLIDGVGLEKSVAAAVHAGVRRFVLVSAFPEAGRNSQRGEGFENYMRVKKAADVHLAASDLDWLIVRPGSLRDEPGDGLVAAGPAIPYGTVRRDNVAAFIAAALEAGPTRAIVELTDGQTAVEHAVAALLR